MQKNIIKLETESGKFYQIGEQLYPSVNEILEKTRSLDARRALDKWRERTPIEIQIGAKNRGTYIHQQIAESFINGHFPQRLENPPEFNGENAQDYWQSIYQALKVNKVETLTLPDGKLGVEFIVISNSLKYAGTVDWLGYWNNTLSLVDFKTSTKIKHLRYLTDLRLQLAAYRLAIQETYNLEISETRLVVILHNSYPQIFNFEGEDLNVDELAWRVRVNRYFSRL